MLKAQKLKKLKFKSAYSQPKLLSLFKFPRVLTEVVDIVGEYSLKRAQGLTQGPSPPVPSTCAAFTQCETGEYFLRISSKSCVGCCSIPFKITADILLSNSQPTFPCTFKFSGIWN